MFLALHALASGSTAMTGVEAISNGVPAFRPPEWKNARHDPHVDGRSPRDDVPRHLVPGPKVQAVPDFDRAADGARRDRAHGVRDAAAGHVAFYVLQIATTMMLVLAANTAFADFPRLASFHAGDDFLPRQFTTRGHRLVFSNGIIALSRRRPPWSSRSVGTSPG